MFLIKKKRSVKIQRLNFKIGSNTFLVHFILKKMLKNEDKYFYLRVSKQLIVQYDDKIVA